MKSFLPSLPCLWIVLLASSIRHSTHALATSVSSKNLPIITKTVSCTSTLIPNGGFSAQLTPDVDFHWKLKTDTMMLEGALRYKGVGWVALGFSPDSVMLGSQAVIAVPDSSGQGTPKLYDLNSKSEDGSGVVEATGVPDMLGTIVQVGEQTTMVFETTNWQKAHYEDGLYTFMFAVGSDNTLGYHKHRGRFRVDLRTCQGTGLTGSTDDRTSPSSALSGTYDHKTAFLAHGVFATLAFAVIVPAAIASAVFRSLLPKWWIYIHVLCNCLAFLFTVISVATGLAGMLLRSKPEGSVAHHLVKIHHWTGLILFLLVCWQVFNGFQRPPVEPKPELKTEPEPDEYLRSTYCCGTIQRPESPREKWQFIHRLTAILVVLLAIFQMQAGIRIYAYEFAGNHSRGPLAAYWIWITLLVGGFISMHYINRRREDRFNQLFRPGGRNIMPQREEEETTSCIKENDYSNII
jgi:hypothetical protein